MMASALGSTIEGSYAEVVETKPTTADMPFMTVLDEYGYYAVKGSAVMPAQARSIGFSMIFAGQDLPAFQKGGKEEAASIGANTNRINAYKTKIQQIKYYTVTLPAKVNQFTNMSFDDFNANSYNSLKSELENLPNLDKSLKNRNSIISARNNCLNRIKKYNSEYLDYLDAMNVSN